MSTLQTSIERALEACRDWRSSAEETLGALREHARHLRALRGKRDFNEGSAAAQMYGKSAQLLARRIREARRLLKSWRKMELGLSVGDIASASRAASEMTHAAYAVQAHHVLQRFYRDMHDEYAR